MFNNKPIDISRLQPTSKMSLKISCLAACENDIDKAQKLYEFVAGGLQIPDTEPISPSFVSQFASGANEIFGWINSHGEDLARGFSLIRGMANTANESVVKAATSSMGAIPEIPPIPKI